MLAPLGLYPAQLGRVSLEIALGLNSADARGGGSSPGRDVYARRGARRGAGCDDTLDLVGHVARESLGGCIALRPGELVVDLVEGHGFTAASVFTLATARYDVTRRGGGGVEIVVSRAQWFMSP